MRNLLCICLYFSSLLGYSQINPEWTNSEIKQADVARNILTISEFERDVILYHNLVRLFPQKYLQVEIQNFTQDTETKDKLKFDFTWNPQNINSKYFKSLIKKLSNQKPLAKLVFDNSLNLSAKCLAKEQSKNGKIGHFRKKCKDVMAEKDLGRFISSFGTAENCGYGVYNGKDAVNQLLIDESVSNLGHRKNILNPKYTRIGVGINFHPKYEKVIVIDYAFVNYFKE